MSPQHKHAYTLTTSILAFCAFVHTDCLWLENWLINVQSQSVWLTVLFSSYNVFSPVILKLDSLTLKQRLFENCS